MVDKAALRRQMAALPRPAQQASQQLCRLVMDLPAFQQAKSMMAFYPMQTEPDIRPLLEAILAAGKQLSLPRCLPGQQLLPGIVTDPSQLEPGLWGIPAPAAQAPCPADMDLILVPGVAFDRAGGRLGHGAGYYDRFLEDFSGITIGLCFQQNLVDQIPMEPHDCPMDFVVTECGIFGTEAQDDKGK